ncbi:transketolase [Psychromonas sp. SR45-3]|uniref:transketolase n=1 Tax=Psychromonas sp. SR45-3 TaxID=2760930 RepID=UPI0015FD3FAC|nr:transketolase [Psychromonas sp. SR45-3]MBB1271634.1 transketolase [Psychromonas sp. SR45-3]
MKPQNKIRALALQALHHAGSGHPGGSLSCIDILYTLYFHIANINKDNLGSPERDRIILSKGHAAPALFATLVAKDILPKKELLKLRQTNNLCEGHPTVKVPGVEATSGPLGIGFSQALGMALGAKLQKKEYRTYSIIGDGECNEGQIWEGAMFATFHKLDNFVAIIDYNKLQSDDYCENITALDPLADKWKAFGWFVIEVDGHNIDALKEAFDRCSKIKGKPSVIIAHTVKGKGISYMENDPLWHGSCAPNVEQLNIAIKELEEA